MFVWHPHQFCFQFVGFLRRVLISHVGGLIGMVSIVLVLIVCCACWLCSFNCFMIFHDFPSPGLGCNVYEDYGFCGGGTHLQYDVEYYDNFIGENSNNRSAIQACCACGGGTGTPLSIAPFCRKDGIRYGCNVPSDTQCALIDLVSREPLVVVPAPAPYEYVFDINNLQEYGWGVVGALVAILVITLTMIGCCVENARQRKIYLSQIVD